MRLLLIDTINTYIAHWSGPWSAPRMPIGRPLTPPASDLAPALRGAVHAQDQSDVPVTVLSSGEIATFGVDASLREATQHAPVADLAPALRGADLTSGVGPVARSRSWFASRVRPGTSSRGGADG